MNSKQFIQDAKCETFTQKVKSDCDCPLCGDKLDYHLQGWVMNEGFPEMVRALVVCEKCKIQIINNTIRKY